MSGCIELRAIEHTRHTLTVRAWVASDRGRTTSELLRFRGAATTTYRWPDVNLDDLARAMGAEAFERLAFHIAAFELNKLCVLEPDVLDFGPWARFATRAFEQVWRQVFRHVWAQWRFENDRPHYLGPRFDTIEAALRPVARSGSGTLLFCGGGKDSLVAARLLERAGCAFDSYAYAHGIYGAAEPQHRLIDGLLDHLAPRRRFRADIEDDFLQAGMVAAETPSSLFGALPVALAQGHARLVLGHERSAESPNLIWRGEPVNHQWGKSLAAEILLGDYIAQELVSGLDVFSLLAPVHDVVIFELLRDETTAVRATHSCNIAKPWCRRCPKCCYVWLGYRAHLPRALVDDIFGGEDLLAIPENQRNFEQLFSQRPFECVGEVDESRVFLGKLDPRERACLIERYTTVSDEHRIPADLAAGILPQLHAAAARARK